MAFGFCLSHLGVDYMDFIAQLERNIESRHAHTGTGSAH